MLFNWFPTTVLKGYEKDNEFKDVTVVVCCENVKSVFQLVLGIVDYKHFNMVSAGTLKKNKSHIKFCFCSVQGCVSFQ